MTDRRPQPDLVALVGSRIAHDLINPLGAIGNGVELLGLSAGGETTELALIRDSIDEATARLGYFRIAFGAARPGQIVAETELRALLGSATDGRRIEIDWRPKGDAPRGAAKLAFLLIQCFETAMPWGGIVRVSAAEDRWSVTGTAERVKFDSRLWELLTDPDAPTEIQPADVHFALVGPAARALGRSIDLTISDTAITVDY